MTAGIGFNLSSEYGKPIGITVAILGLILLVIVHLAKGKKTKLAVDT